MSFIESKIYELRNPGDLYLKVEKLFFNEVGDDELIAKTIYTAISPGTETAAYHGASSLRPGNAYPRLVGYCNVSEIIHVGNSVTDYKIGDHILSFQSHRSVFKCLKDDLIVKLDKGINLRHAVVAYLFHLGYHGLISAEAKAVHNIGIIGVGTLGFTTCMMSKLIGARTFAFTDQIMSKQKLNRHGINCFKKDFSVLKDNLEFSNQEGLDIIINTSNSWNDWLFALNVVNKCGIIVNLGFPGRDQPLPMFNPLDAQYLYTKYITIKTLCYLNDSDSTSCNSIYSIKRNLSYILDMIKEGKLNAEEIISSEISYMDLEQRYEQYLQKESSLLTTILNWE